MKIISISIYVRKNRNVSASNLRRIQFDVYLIFNKEKCYTLAIDFHLIFIKFDIKKQKQIKKQTNDKKTLKEFNGKQPDFCLHS